MRIVSVEDLIKFLRNSINVQEVIVDPDNPQIIDPNYLSMTDEELTLLLEVVLTRDYPQKTIDKITSDCVYPIILLSKKELFYSLAVKEAPSYDLGADNNNYLKRSQKFNHYMKMVEQTDKEYQDYLDDGGAGRNTLTSFNVLKSDNYYLKRNYNEGVPPAPILYIDRIGYDFVELSWDVSTSILSNYSVYISDKEILDIYNVDNKISEEAKKVVTITDVHQTKCRIKGLKELTNYYLCLSVEERSTLTGYATETFTTIAEFVEGDIGG